METELQLMAVDARMYGSAVVTRILLPLVASDIVMPLVVSACCIALPRLNRLPMPAWSGAIISCEVHPVHYWLQLPPYLVIVILAASDATYMALHCQRSCVSGGWNPSL